MHPHINLSTSPTSALIRGRREGREYLSGGERGVDVRGLRTQSVGPCEHVGVDVQYAPTDGVAVEVELVVLPVVKDLPPIHQQEEERRKGEGTFATAWKRLSARWRTPLDASARPDSRRYTVLCISSRSFPGDGASFCAQS